jgi:hypothetical protein
MMYVRGLVLSMLAAAVLVGCALSRNPLPADYSGPKARLRDSVTNYNGTKADYFFLYQYNGSSIRQTYNVSVDNSWGTGFMLLPPEIIERDVPAMEGRYYLIGRTHYAAPIQELTHGIYSVKGEIKFTPEPDATYVIRGALGALLAEIWIENAATGEIVSNKLSTSTPSATTTAREIEATSELAH